MKTILQTIILFLSLISFSQEKQISKFCSISNAQGNSTCIEFQENNRFSYKATAFNSKVSIGIGDYEIKDKKLHLFFDSKEKFLKNYIQVSESESKPGSDIKIKFKIKNKNGVELPFKVALETDNNITNLNEVNKKNEISINYIEYPTAKFIVWSEGYNLMNIETRNRTDKTIEITMLPNSLIINNEKVIMQWIKINNKEFKTGLNSWDIFKTVEK